MHIVFYNRIYCFEKRLRKISILGEYALRIVLWISAISIIFIAGRSVGLRMCGGRSVWDLHWINKVKEDLQICPHDIDYGQYLASQLKLVGEALGENVSLEVTRALQNVMKVLDPQMTTKLEETSSLPTPEYAEVCGEIYDRPSYPFFRSGFTSDPNCDPNTKPTLESLVTVLLLTPKTAFSDTPVDHPLIPLRQLYPRLKAVVATDHNAHHNAVSNVTEVLNVRTPYFQRPGALWNSLVQKVSSPYVLVARGVELLDELARLKRLIFVLSTSKVAVVGGAIRHASGRWRAGCLQTQLRNYALRMRRGYRYSALDCMLCDHLEGPFLTRTDFLRQVPLHNELPDSVVFEDWFLRVKRRNGGVAACPDSLFFVGEAEQEPSAAEELHGARRDAWRQLAALWQLDRVIPAGRPPLHFLCDEVGFDCDLPELHNKGLLVPHCCLEKIERALKAFDGFTKRHGLDYEVSEGTLLGAVKLRSIMPWDTDADLFILSKDFFTYISKQSEMSKLGHKFSAFTTSNEGSYVTKYFTIFTSDIQMDVWGLENFTTVDLPEEIQKVQTRVEINGFWFRGSWNPGLAARNRYGPGYLKHALSWRRQGMAMHMDRYGVGTWGNCSEAFHHSCLNSYPTEGSFDLVDDNM